MKILSALQLLYFIPGMLPILIMLAIFLAKSGQDKNPPYHNENENGDIIVYLFEPSRWGGKYHEYPFVNTIYGLKYRCSDEKKKFYILLSVVFAFLTITFFCIGKSDSIYLLLGALILMVAITVLIVAFLVEGINLYLVKKYLKENDIK